MCYDKEFQDWLQKRHAEISDIKPSDKFDMFIHVTPELEQEFFDMKVKERKLKEKNERNK